MYNVVEILKIKKKKRYLTKFYYTFILLMKLLETIT